MPYTIGVTRHDRAGLWSPIMRDGLRQPVGFGRIEWLPPEALAGGPGQFSMADLMPPATFEVTPEMAEELETVFGAAGAFPAVRIEDGLIGLG